MEAQRASLRQGDVADLDILVGPLVEQLDAANLADDVLGQDLVARGGLDLDLSVVRHVGQFDRRNWRVGCRRLVGRRGISFGWVVVEVDGKGLFFLESVGWWSDWAEAGNFGGAPHHWLHTTTSHSPTCAGDY